MTTQPVQDYMKAIYEIAEAGEPATTTALARRMGVTPASATGMIKKLAGRGLVAHEPYRGVALTLAGERVAVEMVRHHRLVERFLADVLDVPWDEVHDEAERWEHVLSEEIEDRIDRSLEFPTTDPHGAPIPGRDGQVTRPPSVPLSELEPGCNAVIVEVSDHDPELLRYFGKRGLRPGIVVRVTAVEPFDGPVTLRVGSRQCALGREVARFLRVERVEVEHA